MMRRRSSRRHRDGSDSENSSSEYQGSPERPEDLYKELKAALVQQQRPNNIYKIISKLQKTFKEKVGGILRVSISDSFSFNQNDMEQFFKQFGKIQKIVLKQNRTKNMAEDQPKAKETQSIEYCSAILALKVLNSISENERIINAKICHAHQAGTQIKLFVEPLAHVQRIEDMIIEVERQYQFGQFATHFKYVGFIGLDLSDKDYRLRERILGVEGCNFIRIQYLCQKNFKFQHEDEQSKIDDLVLKLISNHSTSFQRQVLVLTNKIQKYNQAIRSLHQLLEQIIEEYKNSKQKLTLIIPKDIHIRKWERFQVETQLKFING